MLNAFASQVLIRALLCYFPKASILGYGQDCLGFYVDVDPRVAFQKTFLPRIQSIMKQLYQTQPPPPLKQMIAQQAQRYIPLEKLPRCLDFSPFKYQDKQLVKILEWCGCYTLVEIEPWVVPDTFPHLQLLDITKMKEGHRIHGVVFSTIYSYKSFIKKWNKYPKANHEYLGHAREFFTILDQKTVLWYPKGVHLQEKILTLWKELTTSIGLEHILGTSSVEKIMTFFPQNKYATLFSFEQCVNPSPFLGLFSLSTLQKDLFYIRSCGKKLETEISSLLNLIDKFSRLMGFECVWKITFPRSCNFELKKWGEVLAQGLSSVHGEIEFDEKQSLEKAISLTGIVADKLGRKHPLSHLKIEKRNDALICFGSLFGALEHVVALYLEVGTMSKEKVNFEGR